jgi:predicted metalloprotease
MVLFTDQTRSGCGFSSAATGPFYCPSDEQVYLDLSFFNELSERFKAPGEFAMAYVIAHEVGHHIQKLTGTFDEMERQRGRLSEKEYNRLSVKVELQADFYAGVWANRAQKMKQILEEGDIASALNAANAIGDDRLQMQGQGYVVPDAFTHGTSQQRMYWFKKGFETGDMRQGNTFEENR